MKLVVGIALATILAVFGSGAISRRLPLIGGLSVRGRDLFVLLGILIGPQLLGVLDETAVSQLAPTTSSIAPFDSFVVASRPLSTTCANAVNDIWLMANMLWPARVTARYSGRRRAPPQSGQGRASV